VSKKNKRPGMEMQDVPWNAASLNPPTPVSNFDLMMSFGKWAGKLIREIPTHYLVWLLAGSDQKLSPQFREHITRVITARGHSLDGSDVMPFGKYEGHAFIEIPLHYLHWALKECGAEMLNAAHKQKIREVLEGANYDPADNKYRKPDEVVDAAGEVHTVTGEVPF
jgi:uncharacterized protein (DUF3820 family)